MTMKIYGDLTRGTDAEIQAAARAAEHFYSVLAAAIHWDLTEGAGR